MNRIRVCGVPEHFNEVWQIGIEKNLFSKENIDLEWISVREGTGAMINKLKSNETDLIVALTEGLINEISCHSSICLIGTYVQSPLLWSISTSIDSNFNSIEDLKGKTFGISRFQSGSHLMSCVLASQYGWKQSDIQFNVENNFDNLRNSVNEHRTDAFMWEYFMQKPFYDRKQIKPIGEIVTPWPCFLIASTKQFVEQEINSLDKLFIVLQQSAEYFRSNSKESIERISSKYHLTIDDATKWFNQVHIQPTRSITQSTIETTLDALQTANILPSNSTSIRQPIEYLDTRIAKLVVDIKSMRLYNKPELLIALRNNLRVHGLAKGSIQYTDLLPFDQNHYFGTQILDLAVEKLNLTDQSNSSEWIIQIGSNLAGCSRYLAGRYNLNVLAIELQSDLSQAAQQLTERCHLSNKIHHLNGNFLTVSQHLQGNSFHSIVSWLTLLHFDLNERIQLLKQSYRLIKPSGFFYFEDFYQRNPLTNQQSQILEHDVFCQYLPSWNEYQQLITQEHFQIISVDDLTQDWKDFTQQRLDSFQQNQQQLIDIHGQEIYSRLEYFYQAIVSLFQQNAIGGIRILAKKI